MPLVHVVVLSALQGLSEALPVSRSGHGAVARLWLDPERGASALEAILHLGTALALGEGVRAVARPALFRVSPGARDAALLVLGTVVSMTVSQIIGPLVEGLRDAPLAVGFGLIFTGLTLASARFTTRPGDAVSRLTARRASTEAPSTWSMLFVGLAHGLAVFPGVSRMGVALVFFLWRGVRPARAVDLAFLLTIPSLLLACIQGWIGGPGSAGLDAGAVAMGLLLAFIAASIAGSALRALLDRNRLGALALWTIPLGLAMLAYARALPHPSAEQQRQPCGSIA
jgi:undecaprenyl-diphosphatase